MKKKTARKVKKEIKKTYNRSSRLGKVFLILLLFLFLGGFVYLYSEGYIDFFRPGETETPGEDPGENPGEDPGEDPIKEPKLFEQDENGFYYYQTDYEPGSYYYSAKNLLGEDLRLELKNIIRTGFTKRSYGEARYILSYSDRDPLNNNESVRGIYDNDVIATVWISQGPGAWQREHVWPKSKLGVSDVNNNSRDIGSDIHNLRAITGINQTKSDRYFAAGSGEARTVGSGGFYPGDDHKGDVARILFYMEIMYDELTLTNDVSKIVSGGTYFGILDLLIQWHKEDPVDEFELQRNEFIYSGIAYDTNGKPIDPQGNRNPFIDRPEYVHLIWEDKTPEDLVKKEEVAEINFEVKIVRIYYVKLNRREDFFS